MKLLIKEWLNFLNEGYMQDFKKLDEMWYTSKNPYDFMKKLSNSGMRVIGSGATRVAYSCDEVDFIVKVFNPSSFMYSNPNKSDTDITLSKYNTELRDIVPKVLHASHDNTWIVVEKVMPISDFSYEDLRKVFPTAAEFFDNVNIVGANLSQEYFKEIIQCITLIPNIIDTTFSFSGTNWRNVVKEMMHINICEGLNLDRNQSYLAKQAIINTTLHKDVIKIFSAMKQIRSSDVHTGNIGITLNSEPSPENIKILDFDIVNFKD
jgi:hypothetical protein